MKQNLIILFLALNLLTAASVKVTSKAKDYQIFNSKNKELYNYYLLKKGKEISFSINDIDTINVITRVFRHKKETENYQYLFKTGKRKIKVKKKIEKSEIVKSLSGSNVSTYNKFSLAAKNLYNNTFSIKNISKRSILVKISGGKINREKKQYQNLIPAKYASKLTLIHKEKNFDYYTASEGKPVEFCIEGPVYLKIFSRMFFNNHLDRQDFYSFKVFINDKLYSEIKNKAVKSGSSFILGKEDDSISKASTHIIKLPAGKNKIRIDKTNSNRNVFYRYFLKKI